ncbi:MAG: DUF4434 domain-containing protein [Clostridia bacterium]|nr:DUF4434 domain-containing protein [Clostridia bacterium]
MKRIHNRWAVVAMAALLSIAPASCGNAGSGGSGGEQSGGLSAPEAVSEPSSGNGPSSPHVLVSSGAAYSVSVKTGPDSGYLTDGCVNDLQLDDDGVLFCGDGKDPFEIELDLGVTRTDLRLFDLWMVRSSETADILGMKVFAAGEDRAFVQVGAEQAYEARPATAMRRIYKLEAEAEEGVDARYVRFVLQTGGTGRAGFVETAVYAGSALGTEAIPVAAEREPSHDRAPDAVDLPRVSWSLVTTMSLYGVTDAMAEAYFDTLEEAGIEGLVVLHGTGTDGNVYGNSGLDHIFREAAKRGMKVFMGMNAAEDIFGKTDAFLAANEKAVTGLYAKYGKAYPGTFCGWYMTQEFSNGDFHRHPDEVASILNGVLAHIESRDASLPLLLSPYCTSWGGNEKQLEEDLDRIFSNTAFRAFDIYCPQDGVGCGYFDPDNAGNYLSAAANACKRKGIRFWVNLENFILDGSVPDGEDDIPAPVSRFVRQMETAAPFAEVLATFTYEAYMPEFFSNYTIYNDIGSYHSAYIEYLHTGKAPDELLPSDAAFDVHASAQDGEIAVWFPLPTYGVSAVRFSRGGKERWFSGRLIRTAGGTAYLILPDDGSGEPFSVAVYDRSACSSGIRRFDADGSPSEAGGPVDRTVPGVNVAFWKPYTSTLATHENGDAGGELTDGIHGRSSFSDPPWTGCDRPVFEVVIDLGEVTDGIGDIRMEVLGGGYGAVMEPKSFSVSFSKDGETYEKTGETVCSDKGTGYAYIRTEELLLETPVSARYVKVTVNCLGWLFTDEIEVIAYPRAD